MRSKCPNKSVRCQLLPMWQSILAGMITILHQLSINTWEESSSLTCTFCDHTHVNGYTHNNNNK